MTHVCPAERDPPAADRCSVTPNRFESPARGWGFGSPDHPITRDHPIVDAAVNQIPKSQTIQSGSTGGRSSLVVLCRFEEQGDDGDDPALPVRYRSGADGESDMAAITSHPRNLFAVHRLAFERAGHWPFLGLEGLAIGMESLKMRILGNVGCRIERLSQDSFQMLADAKELAGRRLCNRQPTRHLPEYLLNQGQLALNVLLRLLDVRHIQQRQYRPFDLVLRGLVGGNPQPVPGAAVILDLQLLRRN